jgi:hypothetical protein
MARQRVSLVAQPVSPPERIASNPQFFIIGHHEQLL